MFYFRNLSGAQYCIQKAFYLSRASITVMSFVPVFVHIFCEHFSCSVSHCHQWRAKCRSVAYREAATGRVEPEAKGEGLRHS